MANTLEELASAMNVSARAGAAWQDRPSDLRVAYEWTGTGETPLGIGSQIELPIARLAVRDGRTVAVTDLRTDPPPERRADLGEPEDHLRTGARARPGHADQPWRAARRRPAGADGRCPARLDRRRRPARSKASPRELRVALETARLLESRERESNRLLALHRASTELATHTDTSTVIESILHNAVDPARRRQRLVLPLGSRGRRAAAGPDLADARRR